MARRGQKLPEQHVSDLIPPPVKDARLDAMLAVAKGIEGWRPARNVLKRVQAVQTIFPQFDRGTRVGGLPIARISTIHGPSNEGKTAFAIGLELSFLQRYHFVAHLDAEMTTPITWIEKMMAKYANYPGFLASRPSSYEQADDDVRRFLNAVGEAKVKGVVPQDTSALVVVDSLRKLTPKNMMAKLLKQGASKVGMDGMGGRGAQMRAALNSQWLDELVPLLHDTNCAMLLIARESEDPDADANDKKFNRDFKIGGGKAVIYDASIVARIERGKWLYQGSEEQAFVIGERIRAQIWKTKVGGKEGARIDTFFHTSNGSLIPEGFDRARDVLELAKDAQIVTGEGHYSWNGHKWHGDNAAVQKLTANPEALAELEAQVRAGFVVEDQTPVEEPAPVKAPKVRKRRA